MPMKKKTKFGIIIGALFPGTGDVIYLLDTPSQDGDFENVK